MTHSTPDSAPACPRLEADILADMTASALDFQRKTGEPAMPMTLKTRYGFTEMQVAVHGEAAVAAAGRAHARHTAVE